MLRQAQHDIPNTNCDEHSVFSSLFIAMSCWVTEASFLQYI